MMLDFALKSQALAPAGICEARYSGDENRIAPAELTRLIIDFLPEFVSCGSIFNPSLSSSTIATDYVFPRLGVLGENHCPAQSGVVPSSAICVLE
jgi:hypothetical protein